MLSVGQVIEHEGVQVKVVDVREQAYEDGSKVTVVTTEPVE